MIEQSSNNQIRAISDIAKRIYNGTIMISLQHRQQLRQLRKTIKFLASGRVRLSRKKRTMLVYHRLIPLLIKPLLNLLDEQ